LLQQLGERNVRKVLLAAVAAVAFGGVGVANANTYTYYLNTIINGSLTTTNFNYGTVTVSDNTSNPNAVDFTINLFGTGAKIQEFDFNTNTSFSGYNLTAYSTVYGDLGVGYSANAVKADGYSTGKFDLSTPDNGSNGTVYDPLTFTLTADNGDWRHPAPVNLDASFFDIKDSSNKLYNAVHIGNCAVGTNACATGQSIWVGANGTIPTPAPEPMSLALLGSGLAAVGMLKRRRQVA
jgi:hypothetical protein